MQRVKPAYVFAIVCVAMLWPPFALAQKPNTPTTTDPCVDRVNAAKASAFSAAWDGATTFSKSLYVTSLGSDPQKMKITLIVEDIDGADSFRFAAAEVIRTQFSERLGVDTTGTLKLWIHGTKAGVLAQGNDYQGINVTLYVPTVSYFQVGQETRQLVTSAVLADSGGTFIAYTSEQKTQVVRELTYKVLSQFFSDWDKSSVTK